MPRQFTEHHVSFVTLSGFRIENPELRELGMTLPGFRQRAAALSRLPGLGLITLAGQLPPHWSCSYHAPLIADEALIETLVEERPTLVAISALTASIREAYALSDRLRQRGLVTVFGGLHVTALPDEAARHADIVVTGAGEAVWPRLLADYEAGRVQPIYRAPRANPPEMAWPMPRFDLLGAVGRYTLQTERGCPLACDFCAASRLLERFREKPVASIEAELNTILALAPTPAIELADDNTFVGNRDPGPLLDAMRRSGARWFTEVDWRIGERPDLLRQLATSGCVQVLIGLESLVFRYPGMGDKAAELERMLDAVAAIHEAGVVVNACWIAGAEGETLASLDRLTQFLLEAPLAEVQVTLQTPFPGTTLRQRLDSAGRLLSERHWSHYTLFEVTHHPDSMTVGDLEQGFRKLVTDVYGPSATARRQRLRHALWSRNPAFRDGID